MSRDRASSPAPRALRCRGDSSGGSLGASVDRHRSRAAVAATPRVSRCILQSTNGGRGPHGQKVRIGSESPLGRAFAEALGRKDFDHELTLLHPEVEFRGLTPGRTWEASGGQAVVDDVLRQWFEESDELENVISIETDSVGDRQRVAYRFDGRNHDGAFVVEQQAYCSELDGRIGWMRVLCSGFRPR